MSKTLAKLIADASRPLEPLPTDAKPRLTSLPEIQAVLFDVYGTLFISGSGDVGTAAANPADEAFAAALRETGLVCNASQGSGPETLRQTIERHHAGLRADGVDFPEVDIVEVWRETVASLGGAGEAGSADWNRLAVAYETKVNPVWPMPGLAECLESLQTRGQILGIVSNAQFFTPLLFPALAGRTAGEFGFQTDLQYYSYRYHRAKPGKFLYELARDALARQSILAASVLYVGNDMLNDIMPARAVGFKTALFAGDYRSLRLRQGDSRCSGVQPDAIVTSLSQIPALIEH